MLKATILLLFIPFSYLSAQVIINGGYSATSNYNTHENDVLLFNKAFFKNGAVILSANGPKSRVVQLGEYNEDKRDSKGQLITYSTQLTKAIPATRTNTNRAIDTLVRTNNKNSTIIFGDHGGPSGVALWGADEFNRDNFLKSVQNTAPGKFVRTVHLHCYSGALIKPDEGPPFLQQFPANLCSLGVSAHDEVGQYLSSSKETKWAFLLKEPGSSLNSMRDRLSKDESITPTIVLTSDYAAQTAAQVTCWEINESYNKCAFIKPIEKLRLAMLKLKCNQCLQAFDSNHADVTSLRNKNAWMQLSSVLAVESKEYYKVQFPTLYQQLFDLEQLDVLTESEARLLRERALHFNQTSESYCFNEAFLAWLDTRKGKLNNILKKQPGYADIAPFIRLTDPELSRGFSDLIGKVLVAETNSQLIRKKDFNEKIVQCHSLIQDPNTPKDFKERYEKIRQCESSPLN